MSESFPWETPVVDCQHVNDMSEGKLPDCRGDGFGFTVHVSGGRRTVDGSAATCRRMTNCRSLSRYQQAMQLRIIHEKTRAGSIIQQQTESISELKKDHTQHY